MVSRKETISARLYTWLAFLPAMGLLFTVVFLPNGSNQYLRYAGGALLILSPIFIFLPFIQLPRLGGSEGKTYMQTTSLVQHGLYAIVRHPQYLGYMLLVFGFSLLLQRWYGYLLASLSILGFYFQAGEEDLELARRFGPEFYTYRERVPQFNLFTGLLNWTDQKQDESITTSSDEPENKGP